MLKKICPLLIALIAALIAVYPPAAARAAEFREEGLAIIGLKGPNALQFEAHAFKSFADRYMLVSGLTRIYDETGAPVTLEELKLPCEARILYKKRASDGLSEAISVNIEGYPESFAEKRQNATPWDLPEIKPLPPQ